MEIVGFPENQFAVQHWLRSFRLSGSLGSPQALNRLTAITIINNTLKFSSFYFPLLVNEAFKMS